MHSDDNFGCLILFESVFDAVCDISRYANLCLHHYICGTGITCELFKQASTFFLVAAHLCVVVDYIESDQSASEFRIAHHYGQRNQTCGIFRILHRDEKSLVIGLLIVIRRQLFVSEGDLLGCSLGDNARNDTREKNHQDDGIQHAVVDYGLSVGRL